MNIKWIIAALLGIMATAPAFAEVDKEIVSETDTVVVTATRIAQHDYRITGNITVIDREDIDSSGARSLNDLLSDALGINVYSYSVAKSTNLDMRGFGEAAVGNVLVLLNDRRLNSVDLSGPDLSRIPIGSVDRVEIIRGAGSVLYGDNAVGGVINIITKKGKGPLTGSVSNSYGSYDTKKTELEVSGAQKNFDYYFYSRYFDTEGYRNNSDELTKDFNARTGFTLENFFNADLTFMKHENKMGLPSGLTFAQLNTLGREATTTPSDFAITDEQSFNFTFDFEPLLKDTYLGQLVIDYNYRNRDVFDSFASFGATNRDLITKGISGKYIFDHTLFEHEINFVTGIDFYEHENDITGSNGSTDDITIRKNEFGAYGFLQFEMLPNVFVNGGTRFHKADYRFVDRSNMVDLGREPDNWVSMGGIKYEYDEGSNVFINAQQTFRYLLTDEWYSSFNGTLKTIIDQQRGIQFEAGVKHDFKNGIITSVTPYRIDTTHEIYFNPNTFETSNYDKIRRWGVEVGNYFDLLKLLDLQFFNKLNFDVTYSYQNPIFQEGSFEGKIVPFVPKHQADFRLSSRFWEHYNVSFGGHYVGYRFQISDFANVGQPLKPYYLVDTKLSYNRENFEIFTSIDNLFDEKYNSTSVFSSFSGGFVYPSPGRSYMAGVKVKF